LHRWTTNLNFISINFIKKEDYSTNFDSRFSKEEQTKKLNPLRLLLRDSIFASPKMKKII
jgi:hypothetical protein